MYINTFTRHLNLCQEVCCLKKKSVTMCGGPLITYTIYTSLYTCTGPDMRNFIILFWTCSYTGFSPYLNDLLFHTSYMSSSPLCVRVLSVNSCVWGQKWTTTGLSETLPLDSWDKCASRWWFLVFTTQNNHFCLKLVNNTTVLIRTSSKQMN